MSKIEGPVSVVIATLGGEMLKETIFHLNQGSIIPSEILICIPEDFAHRAGIFQDSNVYIIKTPVKGQVAQRAYGFTLVKQPNVLQLDDDINLAPDCIQILLEFIQGRTRVAVAPSLLDRVTHKPSVFMTRPKQGSGYLYRLLLKVVNGRKGYQPGVISKAAVNLGLDFDANEPYITEWLPGGCVMHQKENLITYNFYPYPGKAFAEDVIQSILLRRNGITLYHHPKGWCSLDNSSSQGNGLKSLWHIFKSSTRIMFYINSMVGGNKLRLIGFVVLHYSLLIYSKLMRSN